MTLRLEAWLPDYASRQSGAAYNLTPYLSRQTWKTLASVAAHLQVKACSLRWQLAGHPASLIVTPSQQPRRFATMRWPQELDRAAVLADLSRRTGGSSVSPTTASSLRQPVKQQDVPCAHPAFPVIVQLASQTSDPSDGPCPFSTSNCQVDLDVPTPTATPVSTTIPSCLVANESLKQRMSAGGASTRTKALGSPVSHVPAYCTAG